MQSTDVANFEGNNLEKLFSEIELLIVDERYEDAYQKMVMSRLNWNQVEEILLRVIDNPVNINLDSVLEFAKNMQLPNILDFKKLVDLAKENKEKLIEMHKFENLAQAIEIGDYEQSLNELNRMQLNPEHFSHFIFDLIDLTSVENLENIGNFILFLKINGCAGYFEAIRQRYYREVLKYLEVDDINSALVVAHQYSMFDVNVFNEFYNFLERRVNKEVLDYFFSQA